jgi:hypothetical protein
MAETAESIKESAPPGGLPAIASSLGKIGMGGGVYAPGGDPQLTVMKRLASLQQKSNESIQNIEAAVVKGAGVE